MILAILACLIVRRACGLVAIGALLALARPAHGTPTHLGFLTPGMSPAAPTAGPLKTGIAGGAPHPAVARIIVDEKGAQSLGSGTLVNICENCGLVITNWHVVRDAAGDIKVVFPNGFSSLAKVMKVDKDWDLAALAIWRPTDIQPVSISSRAPQLGDPLTIAGYGSGKYRAVTGRCSQYVSPGKNFPFEMVELSAEARQGDSGGPIFNAQGDMAGVLFGASRGTTSGSFGGRVRNFLSTVVPDLDRPVTDPHPNTLVAAAAERPNGAGAGLDLISSQSERVASSSLGVPKAFSTLPTNSAPPGSPANSPSTKMVPVPASAFAEPISRESVIADREVVRSEMLSPGLAGYGHSTLPDREIGSTGFGNRINSALSKRDSDAASHGDAIAWRALAGDNLFEQAKTAFAAIGILAIVFRLLSSSKSAG